MAVKKVYTFDPTRLTYVGVSGDTKPTTNVHFGDLFLETDNRQSYVYSSTGGWVLWESMYSS